MKIKAILAIYRSRRDLSGNTYWAFRVTNPLTGKSFCALAPHKSNILAACSELWGSDYYWHEVELTKGEFKKNYSAAPEPGCRASVLSEWIWQMWIFQNQPTGGNTL